MTQVKTWPEGFSASEVVQHKGHHRIAVCLPARDERETIGSIVEAIRTELIDDMAVIDDLVVIDDGSTDDTAVIAKEAGARVVETQAEVHGKGAALWTSVLATTADIIVWCDADLQDFTNRYVLGLITPLLSDPSIMLVKGAFERPVDGGDVGGRVTELVARPILHLLHPDLAVIDQPLGGEYAGRRHALAQMPFVVGYGVEMGLMLDIAATFGTASIAQVELGTRTHRRRKLLALEPQALEVMMVALDRAGIALPECVEIIRRGQALGCVGIETLPPPALSGRR